MSGARVDEHEAFADTTELTDTVYLVRTTGFRTINPWISKQQPCILPLSSNWVKGKGWTYTYPFPEAIVVQAATSTITQSYMKKVSVILPSQLLSVFFHPGNEQKVPI